MIRRSRQMWPPLIGGSSVQTAILIAMAKHGGLTINELTRVLHLPRPHINKRLCELRAQRVLISFRRGTPLRPRSSPPRQLPKRELMWTIDPRHPLFCRLLLLGRRLENNFPLPGTLPLKTKRQLVHLPRLPKLTLTHVEVQIFGDKPAACAIMLLSRVPKMHIYALRAILGANKSALPRADALFRCGILQREKPNGERGASVISLNRGFCAFGHLRNLARTIDELSTKEYLALTRSRNHGIHRKKLQQINAQRAVRRTLGKPYFLTPTGFAVTPKGAPTKLQKQRSLHTSIRLAVKPQK